MTPANQQQQQHAPQQQAAVLGAGQNRTWALHDETTTNTGQHHNQQQDSSSVVLVKLTDAAIRAIGQHNKLVRRKILQERDRKLLVTSTSSTCSTTRTNNSLLLQTNNDLTNLNSSSNDDSNEWLKPSIRFPAGHQDSGLISIPVQDANGTRHMAEFPFSLSSSDADAQGPQSSFECLAATEDAPAAASGNTTHGILESIGRFNEKIQIKGSADAFTRFGEKMVEAKKESEKRTTQFLDGGPASKSKSVQRRPMKQTFSRNGKITPNSSSNSGGSGAGNGPVSNVNRSGSSISSSKMNSSHHPHQSSGHHPHRSSSAIGSISPNGNENMSNAGGSNGRMDASRSPSDYLGQHPWLERTGKVPQNQQLLKRPLRERIIHLLAVRPFKKPELFSRITREGLRPSDKNNITPILKQVSILKDNTYQLMRHIWNDVSEDWPYYTEHERQAYRRRKPQNLTPPFSDCSTSSSGHSPSSTHAASPPRPTSAAALASHSTAAGHHAGGGLKRSAAGDDRRDHGEASQAAKRRRVSNYVRPPDMRLEPRKEHHESSSPGTLLGVKSSPARSSPPSRTSASPRRGGASSSSRARLRASNSGSSPMQANSRSPAAGSYTPSSTSSPRESGWSPRPSTHMNHSQNNYHPHPPPSRASSSSTPPVRSASSESRPMQQSSASPLPALQGSSGTGSSPSVEHQHPSSSSSSPSQPDYVTEYTTIMSSEQRAQYKEAFNASYGKYRELHTMLETVSRKFENLRREILREEQGSERWESLKATIVQEYKRKRQQRFQDSQREFQYLHRKLEHIKNLVTEYDEKMLTQQQQKQHCGSRRSNLGNASSKRPQQIHT